MRSRAEVVEQPALFGCLRSEADEVSLERGNDEPVLEEHHPSRRSERGLDWFAFFLADIQTGWGPFVAAYLTSKAWTQLDIGLILTVGTLSAMVLQVPVGALVDLIPGKRLLAAIAVGAISGSALLLAFWPVFSVVLVAKVLHAIASCLAGPVLAAISLGLVGHTLQAWPKFTLSLARQCDRRRPDGRGCPLLLEPSHLPPHRRTWSSDAHCLGTDPVGRHRPGSGARRGARPR